MRVQVIDYFDVWGNQEEGYEINDQRTVGEYELLHDTKEEVCQLLKNIHQMDCEADIARVELEMVGDLYYNVIEAETGMPLWGINILD